MQTIWSRAAQSSCHCNCSSCIPYTAALARRTATAAPKRRLRYGDLFTVFYSSILATAAVADANRKDARRKQWDKVIKEAKDELAALETRQQNRLDSLPKDVPIRTVISKEGVGEQDMVRRMTIRNDQDLARKAAVAEGVKYKEGFGGQGLVRRCTSGSRLEEWEHALKRTSWQAEERVALGFEDLRGLPLSLLENLSNFEIEQILVNPQLMDPVRGKANSDPWTTEDPTYLFSKKKTKTFELSVAKMVLRFFLRTVKEKHVQDDLKPGEDKSQVKVSHPQDLPRKIEVFDKRLAHLRQCHYTSEMVNRTERPTYPRYRMTPDPMSDNGAALPSILLTLFKTFYMMERQSGSVGEGPDLDSLISKICYNVLASPTPPTIHTYNTLLVHFIRLKEFDLARAVLASIKETYVVPNEVTVSATLKFYTLTHDRLGFDDYVQRMEGKLTGLIKAYQDTGVEAVDNRVFQPYPRLYAAHYTRDKQSGQLILNDLDRATGQTARQELIQKVPQNQTTYGALIHGALRLSGLGHAAKYFDRMVEEGWEVNIEILTSLLRACFVERDWSLGLRFWSEILALKDAANEKACYWMLCLCLICDKLLEFRTILRLAIDEGVLPSAIAEIPEHVVAFRDLNFQNWQFFSRAKRVDLLRRMRRSDPSAHPALQERFDWTSSVIRLIANSVREAEASRNRAIIARNTIAKKRMTTNPTGDLVSRNDSSMASLSLEHPSQEKPALQTDEGIATPSPPAPRPASPTAKITTFPQQPRSPAPQTRAIPPPSWVPQSPPLSDIAISPQRQLPDMDIELAAPNQEQSHYELLAYAPPDTSVIRCVRGDFGDEGCRYPMLVTVGV
ncbi:hypothetical protein MMC12_006198 [Toensbergia leucococca]|nr:hypothetical protein [Toensbergia leucococca]